MFPVISMGVMMLVFATVILAAVFLLGVYCYLLSLEILNVVRKLECKLDTLKDIAMFSVCIVLLIPSIYFMGVLWLSLFNTYFRGG